MPPLLPHAAAPAVIVEAAVTRELRRSVLRPLLPPGAPLPGDDVPQVVHFAVLGADGAPLSTCFVYPEVCPWWASGAAAEPPGTAHRHLRQMATAAEARGRGLGGAVLSAVDAWAAADGGGLLWCHARETATAFYAAYGWRPVGDVFTDERHPIPHRRMWRLVAD